MVKVGLLGLGTVGSGVYNIIINKRDETSRKLGEEIKIQKILVKNVEKRRKYEIDKSLIAKNFEEIINDPEIQIVVELIGGETPAYDYIKRAIQNHKNIVTANKLVIAKHGKEILKLAQDYNVKIYYEGSVAGGIPVIKTLREALVANTIDRVYGILNGTTNYILTQMSEKNMGFEEALKEAQKLGYAESDPYFDISGLDSAYKISILSHLAYETFIDVDSLYVEGIDKISKEDIGIADELGYVIKLLAIGKRYSNDSLDIRVHPTFVPKTHPLSKISGVYNVVQIHGDAVGDVMLYGQGAGEMPTASAVVADIVEVAKSIKYQIKSDNFIHEVNGQNLMNIDEIENSFYIRLRVNDKPGVFAKIATAFGDNKVSIASVIQKHRLTPVVPIFLLTHPVAERYMKKAVETLKTLEDVIEINNIIRVEGF
ncbi:homoserine dehydrogenase [Petrotoga sp. 9PWA.NaAc.5.4]|uniref:homoserine dehydrogenase n=1 Tax=Petrotoga sp. 9PWA.NaAc.5.4 TaxID=1434328 RepID=UPI000CA67371|nr:homoserine dehydrogenase [Petrotoga sp. 9PWA.NaAc.5.4]PNR95849.1 homoserine dehydrogenase [Petrotoga sp. 9PWA.NaAc.5.4]